MSLFWKSLTASLCLAVLGTIGCGGGPTGPVMASAKGKVTHGDQPVAGAMLNFESTSGQAASTKLNATGEYEIPQIAVGDYTVTLSQPSEEQEAGLPTPGGKPSPPPFPPQFQSAATSTLKAKIEKGKNEHNFDLSK